MKKIIVCFLLLLPGLGLTGCAGHVELNDVAIELGRGVDIMESGQYRVSGQYMLPATSASQQGESKTDSRNFFVVSATGKNPYDGVRNLQRKLSRKIFRGHRRSIYIGEKLARFGLKDMLDGYSRNPNVRLRTDLCVIQGDSAQSALMQAYPYEPVPSLASLKIHEQTGGLADNTLLNFLRDAGSQSTSPTLPLFSINAPATVGDKDGKSKPMFELVGRAIFDKRSLQMVGMMDYDQVVDQMMVIGSLRNQPITIAVPKNHGSGYVSVFMDGLHSSIRPVVAGDKIHFVITLTGRASIEENDSKLDLKEEHNLRLVEMLLNREREKHVKETIEFVQKKYGTDVFGFGDEIFRSEPRKWTALKADWERLYPNIAVTVHSHFVVRRADTSGAPLQLQENEVQK